MERVKGFEPLPTGWKPDMLPLTPHPLELAEPMGFEPTISRLTTERIKPGYATIPLGLYRSGIPTVYPRGEIWSAEES
jgi:hypothetical protein